MTSLGVSTYLAMAAFCLATAMLALWLFSRWPGHGRAPASSRTSVEFHVKGNKIVHATAPGWRILKLAGADKTEDWDALCQAFCGRFPQFPTSVDQARGSAPARISSGLPSDMACLVVTNVAGKLSVRLEEPEPTTAADRHLLLFHLDRLHTIEKAADLFPYPVWLRDDQDALDWGNRAYLDLVERHGASTSEESGPAFDLNLPEDEHSRTERVKVQGRRSPHWFSATKTRIPNGDTLGFAINIDTVVEAEAAQRNFVQTLTKTFAQLSTGLAIFDRERQLVLFNPAIIDLLYLPAEFLASRPTLLTFFDTLRENRTMPEPKDYFNWRQQITDLVIASVDGRYQDVWTLPSGLTYRVTGRPHPDGAIAFLFEDISAEISLTRQFRSRISLGQSVVDTLEEAIAVFSASGVLTFSNKAFRGLWQIDPDTSLAGVSVREVLRAWQALAGPATFWKRLQAHIGDPQDCSEWFSDITMTDGTTLRCRVTRLTGGATLVGFCPQAQSEITAPGSGATRPRRGR